MNIPEIIASQMGGAGALRLMLGASGIKAADDRTLEFRFAARAKDRINMVRVKLDPSDTYSVVFLRAWKSGIKEIDCYSGIYCDQLGELFERRTGLVLRPPRFVRNIGSAIAA
jgi:hypothetical protein